MLGATFWAALTKHRRSLHRRCYMTVDLLVVLVGRAHAPSGETLCAVPLLVEEIGRQSLA
jgi:hypothetical protein